MTRFLVTALSTMTALTTLVSIGTMEARAQSPILSRDESIVSAAEISSGHIARDQRLYVANPTAFSVQFQRDHDYTLFLKLTRPLVNVAGDLLVPAGADVEVVLSLTEDGAQLTAHYILVEGLEIPVSAHSHFLPAQERIVRSTDEKITSILTYTRPIGHGIGGMAFDEPNMGELAGTVLPLILGALFVEPDIEQGAYIPQQSFPLRISTPIEVPENVLTAIQTSGTLLAPTSVPASVELEEMDDVDSQPGNLPNISFSIDDLR